MLLPLSRQLDLHRRRYGLAQAHPLQPIESVNKKGPCSSELLHSTCRPSTVKIAIHPCRCEPLLRPDFVHKVKWFWLAPLYLSDYKTKRPLRVLVQIDPLHSKPVVFIPYSLQGKLLVCLVVLIISQEGRFSGLLSPWDARMPPNERGYIELLR